MVYKGTIVLAKTAANDVAQQLHQQRERVRQELQRDRAAMRVVLLEMRRRGLLKERQRQVVEEKINDRVCPEFTICCPTMERIQFKFNPVLAMYQRGHVPDSGTD